MTINIAQKPSSRTIKAAAAKPKPAVLSYDPSDPEIRHPLVISPFSIVVDTREQAPYRFTGILEDRVKGQNEGKEIIVHLEHYALRSGDYSIVGLEDVVAIERKSLQDFYGSISSGRERFEREIQRLYETHRYACVVIEGDYEDIANPESFTQVLPKTAFRTIQSWEIRYPTVHWRWLPNRRVCEVWTYRQLEMFWRIWQHELNEAKKVEAAEIEGTKEPELIASILEGLSL